MSAISHPREYAPSVWAQSTTVLSVVTDLPAPLVSMGIRSPATAHPVPPTITWIRTASARPATSLSTTASSAVTQRPARNVSMGSTFQATVSIAYLDISSIQTQGFARFAPLPFQTAHSATAMAPPAPPVNRGSLYQRAAAPTAIPVTTSATASASSARMRCLPACSAILLGLPARSAPKGSPERHANRVIQAIRELGAATVHQDSI
jgi:hypothetical protein